MRIRTKLGLTYFSVSLLTLIFISVFIYSHVKQALTNQVLNHLKTVSSLQSHRIEDLVEQNDERIRLVSSRTQLRISLNQYLLTKDSVHINTIQKIISDALASIASFNVISILDKEGNVIVSTNSDKIGQSYANSVFYTVALKKNTAENFFLDDNYNVNLHLSGPLILNDQLIGLLLIESSVDDIISLLGDHSGLGETGETFLGRKSTSGEYVEYLSPLRFDKDAALRRKVNIENLSLPIVQAILEKQELLTKVVDYRGHDVLAATKYIKNADWGLVVKIDEAEAFSSIQELVKYFFIIAFIALFIVILVSYVIANIVSKPIVELTHAAHKIDEGDVSHRVAVRSNDEVGDLAGKFNNMTNNLILTQYDLEDSNKELLEHRLDLEKKVSQRTRELENTIKELESFSYSVSHDLRSPLRSIDGFSAILLEDYGHLLEEEGKDYFSRIRRAAQRMGELIDDILDLSRINRSKIVKEKINLTERVKIVLDQLTDNEPHRKLEFIIQPGMTIYGDASLIDVAITNLINNAWKYTQKIESPKIEFGVTKKDSNFIYYIRDNGIGFDIKYADKLFKVFHRLVEQSEYSGTGIGLATVSRIIERHGGRVWAEGELGKGATFYFTVAEE